MGFLAATRRDGAIWAHFCVARPCHTRGMPSGSRLDLRPVRGRRMRECKSDRLLGNALQIWPDRIRHVMLPLTGRTTGLDIRLVVDRVSRRPSVFVTSIAPNAPLGESFTARQVQLRRNAGPKQKTRPTGQGLHVLRWRRGSSPTAFPRNRDVGIRVDVLLRMSRHTILVARHAHQDQHEHDANTPADETQHYPVHLRSPPGLWTVPTIGRFGQQATLLPTIATTFAKSTSAIES